MSDDLKLGIDVSADLSKLDSSLQRAEQKVAASGQRMQKAATFSPIGAGSVMTGAGGMSAPHPNAVSFASVNTGGGSFSPGGGGFTVQSGQGGSSGAGGAGVASVLRSGWGRAIAAAGIVVGAGALEADAGNILRSDQYFRQASRQNNMRQAGHFLAEEERSWGNIPLVGGMIVSASRQFRNINYEATSGALESARQMESANAPGLFGGGLGGRRRALQDAARLNSDELTNMRANRVHPDAIKERLRQMSISMGQDIQELDIDTQQRDKNYQSQISQMKLSALGLGKYANILSINRGFEDKIAHSVSDDPSVGRNLRALQSATVRAAMLSGLQPAQEVSISGMGGALAQGSVRMGSLSGQSDDFIKQTLGEIAENTGTMGGALAARAVIGR